jgi:hypothetical protein
MDCISASSLASPSSLSETGCSAGIFCADLELLREEELIEIKA